MRKTLAKLFTGNSINLMPETILQEESKIEYTYLEWETRNLCLYA